MAKKIKEFKRCPRCDVKALIYQDKCNACGLVFSRLANASNKEAKKEIRAGHKNRVICDKTLPKDLNKWKLFFMALFLGFFGGHFYYVGKYKTGIIFSVSAVLLMISAAIDPIAWITHYFWMWLLILPASGCLVYLAINWVQILANSFKVPIAIKEEVVVDAKNENVETDTVLKIVEQVTEKVNKEKKEEEKQSEKEETKANESSQDNVRKEETKESSTNKNTSHKSSKKKAKK